jgi:hypothetical protein
MNPLLLITMFGLFVPAFAQVQNDTNSTFIPQGTPGFNELNVNGTLQLQAQNTTLSLNDTMPITDNSTSNANQTMPINDTLNLTSNFEELQSTTVPNDTVNNQTIPSNASPELLQTIIDQNDQIIKLRNETNHILAWKVCNDATVSDAPLKFCIDNLLSLVK